MLTWDNHGESLMIRFQESPDDVENLENKIKEQIQLTRALANFCVEGAAPIDAAELENQRRQISKSIKAMESQFTKLIEKWRESIQDLKAKADFDSDLHGDLISKFIEVAVPSEMQSVWRPKDFTGSLLIFFVDGEIESSSLIEKKKRPLVTEESNESSSSNASYIDREKNVEVRIEPKESFSILKSPIDAKINIYFNLPEPANVVVKIFNEAEELVKKIERDYDEPGEYAVLWDGHSDDDVALPKGTYYCQLQIGSSLSELKTIDLSWSDFKISFDISAIFPSFILRKKI